MPLPLCVLPVPHGAQLPEVDRLHLLVTFACTRRASPLRRGQHLFPLALQLAALEGELTPCMVLFHVALEGLLAGKLVVLQVKMSQGTELAQLGRDAA